MKSGAFSVAIMCGASIPVPSKGYYGGGIPRRWRKILWGRSNGTEWFLGEWGIRGEQSFRAHPALEWTIFSEGELRTFLADAARYGLRSIGPLDFKASRHMVTWNNRRYPFAWMALKKEG